jgi:hypothetical protein
VSRQFYLIGILLLIIGAVVVFIMSRKKKDPGVDLGFEQARAQANEKGYTGPIKLGEPKTLKMSDLERIMKEEELKEAEESRTKGTRITISMEISVTPTERTERFVMPLREALGDLGTAEGGGTSAVQKDGKWVVTGFDINVRSKETEKVLPIIRKCLKAQGAPKDTRIKLAFPKEVVLGLEE